MACSAWLFLCLLVTNLNHNKHAILCQYTNKHEVCGENVWVQHVFRSGCETGDPNYWTATENLVAFSHLAADRTAWFNCWIIPTHQCPRTSTGNALTVLVQVIWLMNPRSLLAKTSSCGLLSLCIQRNCSEAVNSSSSWGRQRRAAKLAFLHTDVARKPPNATRTDKKTEEPRRMTDDSADDTRERCSAVRSLCASLRVWPGVPVFTSGIALHCWSLNTSISSVSRSRDCTMRTPQQRIWGSSWNIDEKVGKLTAIKLILTTKNWEKSPNRRSVRQHLWKKKRWNQPGVQT